MYAMESEGVRPDDPGISPAVDGSARSGLPRTGRADINRTLSTPRDSLREGTLDPCSGPKGTVHYSNSSDTRVWCLDACRWST